jgi:hypothetical protein
MRNQIAVITLAILFLCFCMAAPVAYAEGKCNLQMAAGTWVGYERGSSLNVVVNPPPQDFPFFTGAMAPFVNIVHVTFNSKGIGKGYYWIYTGAIGATEKPIPVEVTITEMNEDCTGKFQYMSGSATIEERFILFDDGREMRSLPRSIENGLPGLVWTGTMHRISEGSAAVNSCGAQTAQGKWLTSVENIVWWSGDTAWADAVILRQDVSDTGDFAGTLYEKLGDRSNIELAIWGTVKVHPDCSFTQRLHIQGFPGPPLIIKGVYFNKAKEAYAMALGFPYSFGHSERIDRGDQ